MKFYYLLAFSLLMISSCGKEVREEVTNRYEGGEKKVVVKYQGTGSEEKILERLTYSKSGELIKFEDLESDSVKNYIDLNPELQKAAGLKKYLQGTWHKELSSSDDLKRIVFNADTLKVYNTFIDPILGEPERKDTSRAKKVWLVNYLDDQKLVVKERFSETYKDFSPAMPDTTVTYDSDDPERILDPQDDWVIEIVFIDSGSFKSELLDKSKSTYSK